MNDKIVVLLSCVLLISAALPACSPSTQLAPAATTAAPEPSLAAAQPSNSEQTQSDPDQEGTNMTFQLKSSAFSHGEPIPRVYSCDGENVSPPLTWTDPPAGSEALVLIMDDPDAPSGDFVHWVLYGLPAEAGSMPQAVAAEENRQDGSRQGNNGRGQIGYTGPCPPGGTHRYFFHLYAVDNQINLAAGEAKQAVLQHIDGHVVATAELMGTFSR